jgi:hypothetical protein
LSEIAVEERERGAGVTVVIPARDEERGIVVTLEALRAVEPGLGMPLAIIVVDDGSNDATGEIAQKAGARVFSHPRSGGYGRSPWRCSAIAASPSPATSPSISFGRRAGSGNEQWSFEGCTCRASRQRI